MSAGQPDSVRVGSITYMSDPEIPHGGGYGLALSADVAEAMERAKPYVAEALKRGREMCRPLNERLVLR